MAGTITDEELLDWVLAGGLAYHADTGTVWVFTRGRPKAKAPTRDRNGREQYQFSVGGRACKHTNRRRTITASRLIWIITNRRTVPDGMDVDHLDGDRHNNRHTNLRARDESENKADNVGTTRTVAYNAGHLTAANGGGLDENPYRADSERFADYAKGFNDYCGS